MSPPTDQTRDDTASPDPSDEDEQRARESVDWSVSEDQLEDSLKRFRPTGGKVPTA